jgi:hypothetical protein
MPAPCTASGDASFHREVTIVAEDDVVRFYLGDVLVRTHPRGEPGSYVKTTGRTEVIRRKTLPRTAVN